MPNRPGLLPRFPSPIDLAQSVTQNWRRALVGIRGARVDASNSSVTTWDTVIPASTIDNDLGIAFVVYSPLTEDCPTPAGWTIVDTINISASARARGYQRVMLATDAGGNLTFTNTTAQRLTAGIIVFDGALYNAAGVFAQFVESVSQTTHTSPTTANLTADGVELTIFTERSGTPSATVFPPAGADLQGHAAGVGSGSTALAFAVDLTLIASGNPIGGGIWTESTANATVGTFTLAISAVSGGGTITVDQTDSAGLTDSAAVEVVKAIAQTDSVGLTDSAEFAQMKVVTDSAGLTDAAGLTVSAVLTDSVGLVDTAAIELSKLVTQTDDAGLTDATALTQSKIVTDSAGLTDAASLSRSLVLTDSTGLIDSAIIESGKALNQTDSVGLTDNQAFNQTHVQIDSAGLTDTASLTVGKVATDSAGLTDAALAGILRDVAVTDSAGLTDAVIVTRAAVLTDLVGLADATALGQLRLLTDSVGLTDAAEASNYFPITFRPNTGTTSRPSSGITPRPNDGITTRP